MHNKTLILLNGPPRAGKDTAAEFLWKHIPNSKMIKLSRPLKDGIKAFYGLSDAEQAHLEEHKDEPQRIFNGKTYRQAQITLSEQWAKPVFGIKVFGQIATRGLNSSLSTTHICSDSGFGYEADPMVDYIGERRTLLIRLHREGCNFLNDSRSYIDVHGVRTVDLANNDTIKRLHVQLEEVYASWIATI